MGDNGSALRGEQCGRLQVGTMESLNAGPLLATGGEKKVYDPVSRSMLLKR